MSEGDFSPGDRVVLIENGDAAVVRWSKDGYSAVNWLDDDPEEFGGSYVANVRLPLGAKEAHSRQAR